VIFLIAHELDSILREMENLAGTVLV